MLSGRVLRVVSRAWEDADMVDDRPMQQQEGKLLQARLEADGRSIRQIAAQAGMSDARWRQIVKGSMSIPGGGVTQVIAPPATLARMATVLGITPDALREAGRDDAAESLELMNEPVKQGGSIAPVSAGGADQDTDEIELILESTSISARQKLVLIRKVLLLRAQADAEDAARRQAEMEPGAPADQPG